MPKQHACLAEVTVGAGGASSIDFTSIPGTWTDLCLVASTRDTYSAAALEVFLRLNNNSSAVYLYSRLQGNGSSASSLGGGSPQTSLYVTNQRGATGTANTFSNFQIYIPNYAGSTAKSLSIDGVDEENGTTAYTTLNAGSTSDTSAINRITLICQTAFAQYSTATLYGITKS